MVDSSDIYGSVNPFNWGTDVGSNNALRTRLALAMMSSKKGYPKTVGEGLTAIGDSLGDIGMARRLMAVDAAQQQQGQSVGDTVRGNPPPQQTSANELPGVPLKAEGGDEEDTTPASAPAAPDYGPSPWQAAQRNNLVSGILQKAAQAVPSANPMQGGGSPSPVSTPSPVSSIPIMAQGDGGDDGDAQAIMRPPQIRSAPPPVQMAQVSGADQPPAYDYTMPRPNRAAPPAQEPESAIELRAKEAKRRYPNNDYLQRDMDNVIKDEQEKRLYRDKQRQEQYQNDILQNRELEMERQRQLQTAKSRGTAGTIQEQGVIKPYPEADRTPVPGTVPLNGYDKRWGTPQSPQRNLMPEIPPVPPGTTPQEHNALWGPIAAKAAQAVETATPEFQRSMDLIRQIRAHPGNDLGLGITAKIAGQIPGTEAYGFHQLLSQLNSENFLKAYTQLRGGGQISNVEGDKATAAIAALNAAQSRGDFDTALNNLEKVMRTDLEVAQRKTHRPVTAWRDESDNESFAPDIGERRKDKNGNVMEYLGGNPADINRSWKRLYVSPTR